MLPAGFEPRDLRTANAAWRSTEVTGIFTTAVPWRSESVLAKVLGKGVRRNGCRGTGESVPPFRAHVLCQLSYGLASGRIRTSDLVIIEVTALFTTGRVG